jgi:vacuolar protein sorting-associated protein 13A/C
VVAKPVVGVIDLATNVSEGIRNTTTLFDSNEIDQIRLSRQVSHDGILRVNCHSTASPTVHAVHLASS